MPSNNIDNTKINSPDGDREKIYWNTWYLAVLLFLVLQIIIFYLITVEFK